MCDLRSERLVSVARAARVINPAEPPHAATVYRWLSRGVAGVRLEAIRIGSKWWTSEEAISRFLSRLNAPGMIPQPPSRGAEQADVELAAKGA